MEKEYLSKGEKKSFAYAGVAGYLVAGIAQSYLMIFFTDILLLPATFIMVILIVARIWDAINDPIMGIVIDRTDPKNGKMKPYVKVGAVVMCVTTLLLFLPVTGLSLTARMIWAGVTYLLFGMAYTLVDVPAMGLMSVSTPNSKERSNLLSMYVTVGTIGGLTPIALIMVMEMMLPPAWVYFGLAVLASVIALTAYMNLGMHAKERFATKTNKIKVKDMAKVASKNKPMLLALLMSMLASPRYLMFPALAYVSTYVITFGGLSAGTALIILYLIIGVGMFVGIFLTPVMYKKFGFKKVSIWSGLLGGVFLTGAFVVGLVNVYVALPFITIGSLALGAYNVLPYPMVGESLDYLEWKTGHRMEGVCFSLSSFVTKFNNAIGFIGLAVGLIVVAYVSPEVVGEIVTQSASTQSGLFALITLVPAIGFFLSIIPMLFYNFSGERKERILSELEVMRANAGTDAQLDGDMASDNDKVAEE